MHSEAHRGQAGERRNRLRRIGTMWARKVGGIATGIGKPGGGRRLPRAAGRSASAVVAPCQACGQALIAVLASAMLQRSNACRTAI